MHAAPSPSWRARLTPRNLHPAQLLVLAFAAIITVGTLLLTLPICSRHETSLLQALFTATSATTVTGLTVVDTATHWTPLGQVVVLVLIKIGGLGIMTFASLIGLVVARRLGLRSRLVAAEERRAAAGGDLRSVLTGVLRASLVVEGAVALLLALRWLSLGDPLGTAIWRGVFHSVSSFNNAGFALFSDGLIGYVGDPFICIPVAVAVILGGFGFPVLFQLWRMLELRPPGRAPRHGLPPRRLPALPRLTLNSKLVLAASSALLAAGTFGFAALEWSNPRTLGGLDWPARLLAAFFQSTVARTAGHATVDTTALHEETLVLTEILMFIGGGPASTAGGIKVTTFAVLFLLVMAEVRGDTTVSAFARRLPRTVQREAITVLSLATIVIVSATMAMMIVTPLDLDHALFETVSAFATVGLSAVGTQTLPTAGWWILIVLMFAGRVGPVTVASALALRSQRRLYDYPKERPLIG